MLKFFKQLLCTIISAQIALMGMPARADTSLIDCATAVLSRETSEKCGFAQLGNQSVGYEKLAWTAAAATDYSTVVENEATNYVQALSSATTVRGGFESQLLGVSPKDAVALSTLLPTNVPWVVGRYSAETAELRIDVYKVEKSANQAVVMSARFTPDQGDYWKAAGAYISPQARAQGGIGRNPFEKFKTAGSDNFTNISFGAARAVLGHAVRMAQAPVGILALVVTDMKTKTKKSGGLLRKTYTTDYYGRAVTRWFVGYPADFGSTFAATNDEAYCVTPGASTACAGWEKASSQLAFEEFTGGTFEDGSPVDAAGKPTANGELLYHDREKKKGWTFLAVLAISFVFSFGMSSLFAVAGSVAGGSSVAGALDLAVAGIGDIAAQAGYSTALNGALGIANGADLGGTVTRNDWGIATPNITSGLSSPSAVDKDNHFGKAVMAVKAKTLDPGVDDTLLSVQQTVRGDCQYGTALHACASAKTGVVTRQDQFAPTNVMRVWRESGGVTSREVGDSPVLGSP